MDTEKQVLCDSQLERFMEAIKVDKYWYDFFYLEIMTGMRRGEICGIKWSNIEFNAGIFFRYEGYKVDRFQCFSLEEIYDSYEKIVRKDNYGKNQSYN